MINILFLFLAWIFDITFSNFFNIVLNMDYNFSPNILFITLILITYKQDKFKSLISAVFVGLFMDLFNINFVYVYTIIYVLTILIVRGWSMRINDTFIELLLTVLAAVFVKEFLLFGFYYFIENFNISLSTFILDYLVNTLMFNLVVGLVLVSIKVYFKNNNTEIINRSYSYKRY